LNPPRQKLYERINQRTEEHFAKGFGRWKSGACSTKACLQTKTRSARTDTGGWLSSSPANAMSTSAIEQTKLNVRHYAKRQLSWFSSRA